MGLALIYPLAHYPNLGIRSAGVAGY
jgi:hypothetical protein